MVCFKCGRLGHIGYQCLQKNNLHIGTAEEKEEDNTTDRDDNVSLDDHDLADDNCRVDASFVSIVRRILAEPKVKE